MRKIYFKNRKSAEELFNKCKSFFSKAKGKEYIKERLLKNLSPLEERVSAFYLVF